MNPVIPISLKRLAVKRMRQVQAGKLSREQASELLRSESRYSSKTRADIVAHLTKEYSEEAAEAFQFFGLL